jgi:hypothetical protein
VQDGDTSQHLYTHDAWGRLVKVEVTAAGGTGSAFAVQSNSYNGLQPRRPLLIQIALPT